MNQQWTLTVQEDPETGDAILEFPPEVLEAAGWKEGDVIKWENLNNGSWSLTKKEEVVEPVLTQEQKDYYISELENIRRGGSEHYASMQDRIFGMGSYNLGPVDPPVVSLRPAGDPYYAQYLRHWGEVESLINQLREEAEKAWGPRP